MAVVSQPGHYSYDRIFIILTGLIPDRGQLELVGIVSYSGMDAVVKFVRDKQHVMFAVFVF